MSLPGTLKWYWELGDAAGVDRVESVAGANALLSGTVTQETGIGGSGHSAGFNGTLTNYLSEASAGTGVLGDRDWTVSAHIYCGSLASNMIFLGKDDTGGIGDWYLFTRSDGSGGILHYASGGIGYVFADTAAGVFGLNTWYNVVGQYNKAGNQIRFRVNNGTWIDVSTVGHTLSNTGATLYFGRRKFSGVELPVTGRLQKVGIWWDALSDGDLTTLYNAGAGLTYSEVLAGGPSGGGGGSTPPVFAPDPAIGRVIQATPNRRVRKKPDFIPTLPVIPGVPDDLDPASPEVVNRKLIQALANTVAALEKVVRDGYQTLPAPHAYTHRPTSTEDPLATAVPAHATGQAAAEGVAGTLMRSDATILQGIVTAAGDLLTFTTVPEKLPVSATKELVLTTDPTQATKMKWAATQGSSWHRYLMTMGG